MDDLDEDHSSSESETGSENENSAIPIFSNPLQISRPDRKLKDQSIYQELREDFEKIRSDMKPRVHCLGKLDLNRDYEQPNESLNICTQKRNLNSWDPIIQKFDVSEMSIRKTSVDDLKLSNISFPTEVPNVSSHSFKLRHYETMLDNLGPPPMRSSVSNIESRCSNTHRKGKLILENTMTSSEFSEIPTCDGEWKHKKKILGTPSGKKCRSNLSLGYFGSQSANDRQYLMDMIDELSSQTETEPPADSCSYNPFISTTVKNSVDNFINEMHFTNPAKFNIQFDSFNLINDKSQIPINEVIKESGQFPELSHTELDNSSPKNCESHLFAEAIIKSLLENVERKEDIQTLSLEAVSEIQEKGTLSQVCFGIDSQIPEKELIETLVENLESAGSTASISRDIDSETVANSSEQKIVLDLESSHQAPLGVNSEDVYSLPQTKISEIGGDLFEPSSKELLEQIRCCLNETLPPSASDQEMYLRRDVLSRMLELPDQYDPKQVLSLMNVTMKTSASNQDFQDENNLLVSNETPTINLLPITSDIHRMVTDTFEQVKAVRSIIQEGLNELKGIPRNSEFDSSLDSEQNQSRLELTASRSDFIREMEKELSEVDSCCNWLSGNLQEDEEDYSHTVKDESLKVPNFSTAEESEGTMETSNVEYWEAFSRACSEFDARVRNRMKDLPTPIVELKIASSIPILEEIREGFPELEFLRPSRTPAKLVRSVSLNFQLGLSESTHLGNISAAIEYKSCPSLTLNIDDADNQSNTDNPEIDTTEIDSYIFNSGSDETTDTSENEYQDMPDEDALYTCEIFDSPPVSSESDSSKKVWNEPPRAETFLLSNRMSGLPSFLEFNIEEPSFHESRNEDNSMKREISESSPEPPKSNSNYEGVSSNVNLEESMERFVENFYECPETLGNDSVSISTSSVNPEIIPQMDTMNEFLQGEKYVKAFAREQERVYSAIVASERCSGEPGLDYKNSDTWTKARIGSRKLLEGRKEYAHTNAIYTPIVLQKSLTDSSSPSTQSPTESNLHPSQSLDANENFEPNSITTVPNIEIDENQDQDQHFQAIVKTPNQSKLVRFRNWIEKCPCLRSFRKDYN